MFEYLRRLFKGAAMLATMTSSIAFAGPIVFSEGWKEQRLSLFSSNDYQFGDRQLGLVSEGAVSIAWTRLPESEWNTGAASWSWAVEKSVPLTDLTRKGGDDRNISLYFVFVPEQLAQELKGANIRSLLGNEDVRIIQYAWGGNHSRGTLIPSPYGPPGQGVTIALRQAGTGQNSESVDLDRDYARAFGGPSGALVGLAISGDSDDTNSVIRAAIGNLTLQ